MDIVRLVLPTGEDGAELEYVLDDVMLPDRLTLFEIGELVRLSGQDLGEIFDGLRELSGYLDEKVSMPVALSRHPGLIRYYQAMVWLLRYRAGERTPSGSVFTFEQAASFPVSAMRFETDPGDVIGQDEEPPDPPRRSPAAGRAGGRGTGGRTAGRSSGGKS